MNKILQEVTDWPFPNHIYEINESGKLVAYRNVLTGKWTTLSKPLRFAKTGRKFKTLKTKD